MRQRFTQQGIALVSAIAFLAVTALFIGTALLVGVSDRQRSADNVRTLKAQFAAEAGVERVVYESWYGGLGGTVPDTFNPDLKRFREGLDALELTDEEGLTAGEKVAGEYKFGEPRLFTGTLQDGLSYEVSVRRADVGGEKTVLRVDVTGWQGSEDNPVSVRRVAEDLVVAPEPGPDYALLTNTANCLFCHTTVTSLEAAYGAPSTRFENTERVKIGGLNNLDTDRVSDLESLVTGTLYARGESNLLGADSTLKSIDLQTHRGRRTNRLGGAGAVLITTLPTYDCDAGCDTPYGAFYENYPEDVYPDAELPDAFPLPVEDTDGDRLISHTEWQRAVAAELEPGTLSGGVRKELYATTHDSGNETALNAERTGTTADAALMNSVNGVAGNLILEGSGANPLILEGTLYIDGDLLIRGAVTGDGRLVVRGNIYLAGDVTYACDENARDGTWESPLACQYDEPETLPRFGLIAGRNILIGTYQTPYVSSFWEGNPGAGLVRPTDQLTRTDFGPASVSAEDLTRWYLDPGKDQGQTGLSAGGEYTAGGPYNQVGDYRFSFTTGQIMLFNQQEFLRASDPGYTPRYYRMRNGSPVYRCELARGDVEGAGCATYTDATLVTPDTGDAVVSLTPTDSWLAGAATTNLEQASDLAVRRAWVEGVETNAARSPGALRVDGLLYATHGLFALNPTGSQTDGEMVLNGALVAADTGLLMPGSKGLSIHYDKRLRPLMDLKKDKILVQQRVDYRLLNIDETLTYEGLTP